MKQVVIHTYDTYFMFEIHFSFLKFVAVTKFIVLSSLIILHFVVIVEIVFHISYMLRNELIRSLAGDVEEIPSILVMC